MCNNMNESQYNSVELNKRPPVAHTCNPRDSGDRDQEDCGSKPAQANSLRDSISKTPVTKKGLVEWLKV
jgi:hypothetical protein